MSSDPPQLIVPQNDERPRRETSRCTWADTFCVACLGRLRHADRSQHRLRPNVGHPEESRMRTHVLFAAAAVDRGVPFGDSSLKQETV
jgi:hypothetical protein